MVACSRQFAFDSACEYAAAGFRLNEHWNLSATVAHASHAELCGGPNDGSTRADLALGYKF
ncbi:MULTISPECIES: acyloxyacyl hydrolase [Ensifer]|uniref:acyloxyacyl hydrolase n=1 Tax=Ensifer TaxID=106591 RepID=UPI00352A9365